MDTKSVESALDKHISTHLSAATCSRIGCALLSAAGVPAEDEVSPGEPQNLPVDPVRRQLSGAELRSAAGHSSFPGAAVRPGGELVVKEYLLSQGFQSVSTTQCLLQLNMYVQHVAGFFLL